MTPAEWYAKAMGKVADQVSVGPVGRGLIREAVVECIREAVAAERERCAKVATDTLESACSCNGVVKPCAGCRMNKERQRIAASIRASTE